MPVQQPYIGVYEGDDEAGIVKLLNDAYWAGSDSATVIFAYQDDVNLDELDLALKSSPIPVSGATYWGAIVNGKLFTNAAVVIGNTSAFQSYNVNVMTKDVDLFENELVYIKEQIHGEGFLSISVATTQDIITPYLDKIYSIFGCWEHSYFGSRACPISNERRAFTFSRAGLIEDSIQIVYSELDVISHDSYHGWTPISGPHVATGVQDNIIETIDLRPALSQINSIVRRRGHTGYSKDQVNTNKWVHSIGVSRLDADPTIFHPIATDGEALICSDEIPLDSEIYILQADSESLLNASKRHNAKTKVDDAYVRLFTYSANRHALLSEQDFAKEVADITAIGYPSIGVLSHGQLSGGVETCIEMQKQSISQVDLKYV